MLNKVWLIDDDDITLMIGELYLNKALPNALVYKYSDPENGLNTILQFSKNENFEEVPEIIFLDLNMKGMNGWEFIDKLNSLWPSQNLEHKPSIVLLSSSIQKEDFEKSNNLESVLTFISKPIDNEKIEEIKSLFLKAKTGNK
jgi:CheY-like chemotaxis protein